MVRSIVGFSIFAILSILAIKLVAALLGAALGILGTVLWFAFLGFVFYLILKLISPSTARSVREMITGKPTV